MNIVATTGNEEVAMVYVIDLGRDRLVECAEAVQPPIPRAEKWVLLISTMCGCPVGCKMCDAGGAYKGNLTAEEILAQIDFLVASRYPDQTVPARQFKIQFARMGEPSLNRSLLRVLEELPERYEAPGLMPSLSTIAPAGTQAFFDELLEIKERLYSNGRFQFQFSLHTTDQQARRELVPVRTWDFAQMAAYGERFSRPGDRKITLNFALARDSELDAGVLRDYFDPARFLVKITPLNPTYRARENGLLSYVDPLAGEGDYEVVQALREAGYQVIVSIGEVEENFIGSNCGQYVLKRLRAGAPLPDAYTYDIR